MAPFTAKGNPMIVDFDALLWCYQGASPWYFVTVPKQYSEELKLLSGGQRRGFGAIRVNVRIGQTAWQTSIFPSKQGSYDLPVKASVRKAEQLKDGDPVTVHLAVE
jgi:hypothetical protein